MSKRPQARQKRRAHLPFPGDYRNDAAFQRKLDAFFLRTDGRPALERLEELGRAYKIGGAPPYIAVREASDDRGARMIVLRHSESGEERSTGMDAQDLTSEQASVDPAASAELASFAEDILFGLRIRNAPKTVMYATAINHYLETRNPGSDDPAANRRRLEQNKQRNIRDPLITFNAMTARAKVLIGELFKGRTFDRPPHNLPQEIKRFLERRALETPGVERGKHGEVPGALDGNVAAYVSLMRQTCDWLIDEFHPPIDLSIAPFKVRSVRSEALTWSDCRDVMLFAQGYVFENGGFARHWVERDGEYCLEYKKLEEPRLSEHRAEFLPLLRFVPTLATTGSRPMVSSLLRWEEDDYFGYVTLEGKRSKIHRTGIFGPNYANKPRETSALTPLARGFFQVLLAKDLRKSEKDGWPLGHVIHNGRGGAVDDLAKLFKRACEALGIKNSARKLKHLAVTMHWFAGFELERIGGIVGTDPKTTRDKYLYLEKEYAGLMRPRPIPEKMTFADLADPSRDIAKIPRAPAPPRPTECRTRATREAVDA